MLTSRHTEPLYKRSVLLKNPDVFHLKKKKNLNHRKRGWENPAGFVVSQASQAISGNHKPHLILWIKCPLKLQPSPLLFSSSPHSQWLNKEQNNTIYLVYIERRLGWESEGCSRALPTPGPCVLPTGGASPWHTRPHRFTFVLFSLCHARGSTRVSLPQIEQ